jgi:hypothetical protein
MGERGPGRQLDLRQSHVAADLRGPVCLEHFWFRLTARIPFVPAQAGTSGADRMGVINVL